MESKIPTAVKDENIADPPYDKKGKGRPATGAIPITIARLRIA